MDGKSPGALRTVDVQSGEVSTLVTAPADLQFPSDIVVSPSGNSAYVADSGTNRVVSIDIETGTLSTLVENPSSEPPGLQDGSEPDLRFNLGSASLALTLDGAYLLLAESANSAIRKIHVTSGQGASVQNVVCRV